MTRVAASDTLVLTNAEALALADELIHQQASGTALSLREEIAAALQEAHRRGFTRCLDKFAEIRQVEAQS